VLCVSSQHRRDMRPVLRDLLIRHLLVSDPTLRIGRALGLPSEQRRRDRRYRRVTLVTHHGRVLRVFFPLLRDDAAENARNVLDWLAKPVSDASE
jgi:hypothetical protein